MPEYAKPTIVKKLKDKELQRVADDTIRMGQAQGMINNHVDDRKEVRHAVGFMNTKRTGNYALKTQRMAEQEITRQKLKASQNNLGLDGDVKQVTVKTANKTIRVMR